MKAKNHIQEISVQYSKRSYSDTTVKTSADAGSAAREIYKRTNSNIDLKEYFFILLLNRANHIIGFFKLSEGGISGTVADKRLVFATAMKCLASAIILVHNHPSGNLKPSESDLQLTKSFKLAGEILDVKVMDHIILSSEGYFSFGDEGII